MNKIKTLLRNINYLTKISLWEQREKDIVYLSNKILDDGIYEYKLKFSDYKKLKILNKKDSLNEILCSGKSFVRMSDGEIGLMQGINQPFQCYEPEIGKRLLELLKNQREDILVGINRDYYIPYFRAREDSYMRRHAYDFRKFFDKYCNFNSVYIDAACTFNYVLGYSDDEVTQEFWNAWKNAFKNKKLVVVCGEKLIEEMQYNIFEDAESIKYIYGPRRNAWNNHEQIIEQIRKEDKQQLIVFILGMAGKAMIPEVTELGYVAWDVGHLAKGYNAYRMGLDGQKMDNIIEFYKPD